MFRESLPPLAQRLPSMDAFLSVARGRSVRLFPLSLSSQQQTPQQFSSAFARNFCRTCLRFNCLQHPAPPPQPPPHAARAAAGAKECFGMSSGCGNDCCRLPHCSDAVAAAAAVPWSAEDAEVFSRAMDFFFVGSEDCCGGGDDWKDGRVCFAAAWLQCRGKTCLQAKCFYDRWRSLFSDAEESAEDGAFAPKTKARMIARRRRSAASRDLQQRATTAVVFTPCAHVGPCTDCHRFCEACIKAHPGMDPAEAMAGCTHQDVVQRSCQKFCLCDAGCSRRRRGCKCAPGTCGTSRCSCRAIGMECDPDLCENCASCFVSRKSHCGNMAVQCGRFKRTLIGKSTIPDAGWGLFLAEDAAAGELIGVYGGELTTRSESSRVDAGQYSSGLNEQLEVSGLFIGNKLRFINDPDPFGNTGRKANSQASVVEANGSLHYTIRALCDIPAGSELFFEYGNEYWEMLRG